PLVYSSQINIASAESLSTLNDVELESQRQHTQETKSSQSDKQELIEGSTETTKERLKNLFLSYFFPLIFMLMSLTLVFSMITPALWFSNGYHFDLYVKSFDCKNTQNSCSFQIVESIPYNFTLNLVPNTDYTYNAWIKLIENAKREIV